jgi:hypothetical protein
MGMLAERGVMYTHTIPYTPQQAGVVERFNRSVVEITRSLLSESGRRMNLWPEAYATATYLFNRRVCPSRVGSAPMTRYEHFTGIKPSLDRVRIWGCKCYVHLPHTSSKLHPRGVGGICVGYDEYSHGYIVQVGGKNYIRENVVFSETELGPFKNPDLTDTPATELLHELTDEPVMQEPQAPKPPRAKRQRVTEDIRSPALHTRSHRNLEPEVEAILVHAINSDWTFKPSMGEGACASSASGITSASAPPPLHSPSPMPDMPAVHTVSVDDAGPALTPDTTPSTSFLAAARRRDTHTCIAEQSPPQQLPPLPTAVVGEALPVPSNFQEARNSAYWGHWHKAINEEFEALKEMQVFEIAELPAGKHAISSKWVFSWKLKDGAVVKSKARIVARGFEQSESDYSQLFSPTICTDTLRMLMAHSTQTGCYVHQLDIKTAFLYGTLEEEIFLQPPPGCEPPGGMCWRLLRSLYGLRQSPRQWYKKLKSELVKLGFTASAEDQALFYKMHGGHKLIVCVHVDDMLVLHPDKSVVLNVVSEIKKVFTVTDLGQVSNYLKLNVESLSPHAMLVHQSDYVAELLSKFFNKTNLTPGQMYASTPLPYDFVFRKLGSTHSSNPDDLLPCDTDAYRSIIGSLMYLANMTRPDIVWAVNQCSRYMSAPSVSHYKATQFIFRYLNATHDMGLLFNKTIDDAALVGFCDASHQSCQDTARSCTGYLFMMGGTAIAFQSKQQPSVALSTAESEYMAISAVSRCAVWLEKLHFDIVSYNEQIDIHVGETVPAYASTAKSKSPVDIFSSPVVYNDNQSAIAMVNNDHSSKLTKHISKVHHWARDKVEEGILVFKHVAGTENPADILTKWLPAPVFTKHRHTMGLRSLKDCKAGRF